MEDYLRADSTAGAASSRDIVIAYVLANPGLTLEDLMRATATRVQADDIFRMIATHHVYVDLHAAPLAEPSRVEIYGSAEAASAVRPDDSGKTQCISPSRLQCGSTFIWDARLWRVINVGNTSIGLLSEGRKMAELPIDAFEILVREKRIQMVPEDPRKPLKRTSWNSYPGLVSVTSEPRITVLA